MKSEDEPELIEDVELIVDDAEQQRREGHERARRFIHEGQIRQLGVSPIAGRVIAFFVALVLFPFLFLTFLATLGISTVSTVLLFRNEAINAQVGATWAVLATLLLAEFGALIAVINPAWGVRLVLAAVSRL